MTIGSDTANNHGSEDVSGKSETSMELDDFYFGPTVLTGKPGQTLKIELENESKAGTLHNFSISDQNIDQDVSADQKVDVTVTFPQSGFVEFFCKYHKTSGMVGELTAS
jgi:plastocyanin